MDHNIFFQATVIGVNGVQSRSQGRSRNNNNNHNSAYT